MNKKIIKIGGCIIGLMLLCSCSVFGPATPTTHLRMKVGGQTATWTCPKQFVATNLVFSVNPTNGTATLSVGYLSSYNSPTVINDSYTGQAALVKQWGETANQLIQTGAAAAGKAAGAAVK